MDVEANRLIDALGGTTEVARMTKNRVSTVHSWRRVGLSEARRDHLRLAAERDGKVAAFQAALADRVGEGADHSGTDIDPGCDAETGKAVELSAQQVAA